MPCLVLSEGRYTILQHCQCEQHHLVNDCIIVKVITILVRSMLPSDLQLMLKPDCKASVDVITEKYSGVRSALQHVNMYQVTLRSYFRLVLT